MSAVDDQDYRFLTDLYKMRNITKVAQLHYLSQPAMTKRIRHMEEELGCQLILRSKKGVTFTFAGELVIKYCMEMMRLGDELRDAICHLRGTVGGSLSIGSSLNYSRYRLPSALRTYQQRYPLVDIDVSTGHSDGLRQLLLDNRISVAIVRGKQAWTEGSLLLSKEPVCLVCNAQNSGRPLQEYPYIGHHTEGELARLTDQWLIEHGLSPQPKLWIDDIASCREMAAEGVGWTIIPNICLEGFQGDMIPLRLRDGTAVERETYILYRTAHIQLQQVKCFIDILMDNERMYAGTC